MLLREMQSEEAVFFSEWEKQERPYPWSAVQFQKSQTQHTLVWTGEKAILGFGVVQIVDEEAYLLNLMVNPLLRRKGHGFSLLEQIEQWCRQKKSLTLMLDVDEKNFSAVNLYQKRGFVFLQRRPQSYPKGETALLMKKTL